MKKRSKKRIPQDVKAWARVRIKSAHFYLPTQQTVRWTAGARRDWETKILTASSVYEHTRLLLNFYSKINFGLLAGLWRQNIFFKLHNANKFKTLSNHKKYCLLTGRARTFNRTLSIARHSVRKLAGVGLLSGLMH